MADSKQAGLTVPRPEPAASALDSDIGKQMIRQLAHIHASGPWSSGSMPPKAEQELE